MFIITSERQKQEGAMKFLDTIARIDPELYEWWMNTVR
jgi:hypothetical protein